MSTNYNRKTISSLKWKTASNLLIQLYNFIVSVIAARILDPKDFGIMAIGLIVINYANTITNFGFNNALIQKDNIDESHFNSVFSLDLAISVVLTVFTFTCSSYIASFFNIPECGFMFKVLSMIYILTTLEGIPRVILRRSINFSTISKIDIAGNFINGIIVVALALMGFGYWALLMGKLVSLCLVTSIFLLKTNWVPKLYYSHDKMKAIYRFGIWNFFRSQLYYFNKYIMQVITGKVLGVAQLGYFEKSFSMSQIPIDSIGLSINSVMFSTFSRYQKNPNELNKWLMHMITIQTILIMPLFMGLFAVASHFIIVVLGVKWSLSILPMRILCVANALSLYNGGLASLNIGIGNYKQHTIRTFLGSCILIVASLFLVRYGLEYICIAYLFVSALWTILSIELALKYLTISFKKIFVSIFPYMLANFCMLVVVSYLSFGLLFKKDIINLILIVFTGCLVYTILVILINLSKNRNWLYPIKV